MPTETLDPRELELWKPRVGTKFRRWGRAYTVVGKVVIGGTFTSGGTIQVRRDGSGDSQWMYVRKVARLVRDQGGAR